MTNQETNEVPPKNKKRNKILLEFVGFIDYGGEVVFGPNDGTKKGWHYPNGDYLSMNPYDCPNLCGSLDAQAKWLWPKLAPKWDDWQLSVEDGIYTFAVYLGHISGTGSKWAEASADTPAEACAEAVLSLIGEE